jgi:starch synthase (maltosyl-transferring)
MSLRALRARLGHLQRIGQRRGEYSVPSLWVDPDGPCGDPVPVDPIDWWADVLARIEGDGRSSRLLECCADWTRDAVVYSLFVRATAAFDHDGDGRVVLQNGDGFRETGTFVKAIALLPYVRSLGCNTVHLLPVTAIGSDGRKGALGSPYAVRNPYRLDESLAEPVLGLGAETEFAAFVEAAHRLGLRVVLEFVLRTAAKDSDWVSEHPEWFYWIRGDVSLGSPMFTETELRHVQERVAAGDRIDLPPPSDAYRSLFVRPELVADVAWNGTGWVGRMKDGTSGRIPGAFADWPPDDTQPAWSDVTYLRMYDHHDFNYMAYNTLRMYDTRLARPEYAVSSLWDRIAGIIPHYQERFRIDGALIDMGHALPSGLKARVIRETRNLDAGFAFWDEEFRPSAETRSEGYNAVVGNYWWEVHRPAELRRRLLRDLSKRGAILPFFAAPETHNTPRCASRAGGSARSRLAWVLGCFLPAVPFVHSGFDLGETQPVNTGLDFSAEEIARHPPERLALYSPLSFDWAGEREIVATIRAALAVRSEHRELVTDSSPSSLRLPHCADERIVGYVRAGGGKAILVVGLFGGDEAASASIEVPFGDGVLVDVLNDGRRHRILEGKIGLDLNPWDAVVVVGRCDPPGDAAGR